MPLFCRPSFLYFGGVSNKTIIPLSRACWIWDDYSQRGATCLVGNLFVSRTKFSIVTGSSRAHSCNLECARVSFSKSWNCTNRFGECNFIFLKNSQVPQSNFKLYEKKLYNYTKHEQIREVKVPEDISWSHFFRIRENFFQNFRKKISPLLYMSSVAYKNLIVFLQIIIQNYDV